MGGFGKGAITTTMPVPIQDWGGQSNQLASLQALASSLDMADRSHQQALHYMNAALNRQPQRPTASADAASRVRKSRVDEDADQKSRQLDAWIDALAIPPAAKERIKAIEFVDVHAGDDE